MSEYATVTKFDDDELIVREGIVKSDEPLTISVSDDTVLSVEKWTTIDRFTLTENEEKTYDLITDNTNNLRGLSEVGVKNGLSVISDSEKTRIRNINDKLAIYKSKVAYDNLKETWFNDTDDVQQFFELHECVIENVTNIKIEDSPLKQSDQTVFIFPINK